MVIEVVQAAFTDRDHVGIVEKRDDGVDAVLGLVWMQAGSGEDAVVRGSHSDGFCRSGSVATDVDHRSDSSSTGGADHVVDSNASRVMEMAVAVGVAVHGSHRLAGEQRFALGDREPAGVATPRGRGWQALVLDATGQAQ